MPAKDTYHDTVKNGLIKECEQLYSTLIRLNMRRLDYWLI